MFYCCRLVILVLSLLWKTWEQLLTTMSIFGKNRKEKTPAANGRFGASGGVGSSESEQVTSSFALVQTAVKPPPVAKPLGRYGQPAYDGTISHLKTAKYKILHSRIKK